MSREMREVRISRLERSRGGEEEARCRCVTVAVWGRSSGVVRGVAEEGLAHVVGIRVGGSFRFCD